MKNKMALIQLVLVLTISMVNIRCSETVSPPSSPNRAIDPIVSTEWLEDNIDKLDLVLLDVRGEALYNAGHIPGSINLPAHDNLFVCFFEPDCGLTMETPPVDTLINTIGNAGITANSNVVVIGRAADLPESGAAEFGVTMASRAAITLLYAGIDNVAFLDGGYDKWVAEGRASSTEAANPDAVEYNGAIDTEMFVSKDYVAERIGKSILVDTRDADVYFGIGQDPTSQKAGHIPGSKVLPAPWFWTRTDVGEKEKSCLMWKSISKINEIGLAVLGENGDREIIIYCGVGGYASPVFFVLTEVIGYRNVKFYDGSMQEWTADPEAPVTKYRYQ